MSKDRNIHIENEKNKSKMKAKKIIKTKERCHRRRRPLGRVITNVVKFIIVYLTFFVMKVLNRTHLHDPNKYLQNFIFNRNATDVGLLTISNHCSILDDPGLWCGTLPIHKLTLENIRNIIMVEESYYCLGKLSASILYGLNCLPIRRGDIRGLKSPQLESLWLRLNGYTTRDTHEDYKLKKRTKKREWCHIMVEGRILQPWRFELPDGHTLPQLGTFRLGAAKLIATSPPSKTIVLPIYHYGMHKIFPETPPKDAYKWSNDRARATATRISGKTKIRFPRCGNRIDVYVGDPVDFTDLVPPGGLSFKDCNDRDFLAEINSRLHNIMLELESKASQNRR